MPDLFGLIWVLLGIIGWLLCSLSINKEIKNEWLISTDDIFPGMLVILVGPIAVLIGMFYIIKVKILTPPRVLFRIKSNKS